MVPGARPRAAAIWLMEQPDHGGVLAEVELVERRRRSEVFGPVALLLSHLVS
jgi:hypothetical protein